MSPLGLPYGKGRSPLNWSIIRGFNQVYFNLFKYVIKMIVVYYTQQ